MRHTAYAVVSCLLLSNPALGAAGDVLRVTGNNVNVRTGPGIDHAVSRQVDRDRRVIEIAREGDWVRAEITGTGAEGWIHASLLTLETPAAPPVAKPAAPLAEEATEAQPAEPRATATGAAATSAPLAEPAPAPDAAAAPGSIAPGAAPEVDAVDLQRFRDSVDYLNSRALAVAGAGLFTEVEPLGGGTVQVGATDAWATLAPAGQRSYANTLLDRWAAATGHGAVKVQIVDEAGQVLMEESRP